MKSKVTVGVMLCVLSGIVLLFAGCAETAPKPQGLPPLSASEMVGTWRGTMQWAGAVANQFSTRITLNKDGTVSGSSSAGGELRGTWSVSGDNYTDSISTTVGYVTFSRSGTVSGSTITGRFNAVNGGMGTFTMTKGD
jgi:hypothetical protein